MYCDEQDHRNLQYDISWLSCQCAFGGDGRNRTAVQRIVQQPSTNSLFILRYYTSKYILGEAKYNLPYSQ